MDAGIAYVPEDRGTEASLPGPDRLRQPLAPRSSPTTGRACGCATGARRADSRAAIDEFFIRASSEQPDAWPRSRAATSRRSSWPAGCAGARVLLLDEPTQGVDVSARAEIYALVRNAVAEGARCWSSPATSRSSPTCADRVHRARARHASPPSSGHPTSTRPGSPSSRSHPGGRLVTRRADTLPPSRTTRALHVNGHGRAHGRRRREVGRVAAGAGVHREVRARDAVRAHVHLLLPLGKDLGTFPTTANITERPRQPGRDRHPGARHHHPAGLRRVRLLGRPGRRPHPGALRRLHVQAGLPALPRHPRARRSSARSSASATATRSPGSA